MNVKFKIEEECYFNNGRVFLDALPNVEDRVRNMLSQTGEITIVERHPKNKPPYNGVKADSLNKALRVLMGEAQFKGETHVENGVFFHKTKEGFDFSDYDEEYNLTRLYNYYQGSVGILDGEAKIIDVYKKLGYKKREWRGKIAEMQEEVDRNNDIVKDKKSLTVVGEIQFGNWALIYRDLFRLLNADDNPGIDFYIYITASEALSGLLSSGTVSYDKALSVITQNLSVIKVPIWLIGLNIE